MNNGEKFDIAKVKFRYNLQGVKEGCEGYVANSLLELYTFVVHSNQIFYKKIFNINAHSDHSFGCDKGFAYKYFYLIKEPKYRPFTWEEREQLRGKWVKWINLNNEFQLTEFYYSDNRGFIINNNITPETLLEMTEFLDGSPCGVLMEDD